MKLYIYNYILLKDFQLLDAINSKYRNLVPIQRIFLQNLENILPTTTVVVICCSNSSVVEHLYIMLLYCMMMAIYIKC